jgi:hypothetical protein
MMEHMYDGVKSAQVTPYPSSRLDEILAGCDRWSVGSARL